MGMQIRNYTYGAGKVVANGQEIGRVNGATLDIAFNEINAKSAAELDPYAIELVGREITGTIEFKVFSKEAVSQLLGATSSLTVTTGYVWTSEAAYTIAANVTGTTLNPINLANPVISGSAIVQTASGNVYQWVASSPATGQFSYLGTPPAITGFSFAAADAELSTVAKVSFAQSTTDGDNLQLLTTDTPNYVELFLSTVGRNTTTEAKTYQVIRLPKVMFLGLTLALQNEDFSQYTAKFRAKADTSGKIVEICSERT